MNLVEHMRSLWQEIGYKPDSFSLDRDTEEDNLDDIPLKNSTNFTPEFKRRPPPSSAEKERYSGISIRNFPKNSTKEEVIDFLKSNTVDIEEESVFIHEAKNSVSVEVSNEDNIVIESIIEKLEGKQCKENKLFLRGIVAVEVNNSEEVLDETVTERNNDDNKNSEDHSLGSGLGENSAVDNGTDGMDEVGNVEDSNNLSSKESEAEIGRGNDDDNKTTPKESTGEIVDKEKRVECRICQKTYNVKSMAKHMRSMHPSPCEIDRSLHGFDKASARGRKGSWQKRMFRL